jgi:hypothetical protein
MPQTALKPSSAGASCAFSLTRSSSKPVSTEPHRASIASYAARAAWTSPCAAVAHWLSIRNGARNDIPSELSRYSTLGGVVGKTCRSISPSRNKFRNVAVSMRCEISSIPDRSCPKRLAPSASPRMIRTLHLSPMRSRMARTEPSYFAKSEGTALIISSLYFETPRRRGCAPTEYPLPSGEDASPESGDAGQIENLAAELIELRRLMLRDSP